jgi:hypothetical protein
LDDGVARVGGFYRVGTKSFGQIEGHGIFTLVASVLDSPGLEIGKVGSYRHVRNKLSVWERCVGGFDEQNGRGYHRENAIVTTISYLVLL